MSREGTRPELVRIARDAAGGRWRIWVAPDLYDRRARPALVFETDSIMRRVRDYPDNWMDLGDDELLALSLGS